MYGFNTCETVGSQLRVVGINIPFRAQIVQVTMRSRYGYRPIPVALRDLLEGLRIRLRLVESIELIQMSAMSFFDTFYSLFLNHFFKR